MATKKISALTELTTPAGTEELIVNAGGTSKKIQIDNLPSSLADNSVTLAKMAAGTDGNLITYDASGDPAYVTTGTSGQVLTSGGTGVAPTFQAAAGADTSLSNLSATGENKVCQAWVNFNGTGTVAIRDSHNCSSITDHSTGNWTVVYTNAIGANNCVNGYCKASAYLCQIDQPTTANTANVRAIHNDGTVMDVDYVSIIVFGD